MKRANLILLGYVVVLLLTTPLAAVASHGEPITSSPSHFAGVVLFGLAVGVIARVAARLLG